MLARAFLLAGLASALLAAPAGAAPYLVPIKVSAGPLARSLDEIARQTQAELLFDRSKVAGFRAPAIEGRLTPIEAIQRVIGGSGLIVRPAASGALIVESPAAPPLSQPDAVVPELLVIGRRSQNADIRRQETDIQPYRVTTGATLTSADRDDIEQYFDTRVPSNTEVLTQRSPNEGLNNSEIDLRGLGADQTLVLIDGRRMPGVPGDTFGFLQPDLNAIPLHAVGRIETLTGTAGGIYGFGALGGVVNVVLARDRPGAEVYAGSGVTARGDAVRTDLEARIEFSPDQGRTDVTLFAGLTRSKPLTVGEGGFLASDRLTTDQIDPQLFAAQFPHGQSIAVFDLLGQPLVLKPQYGGATLAGSNTFLPAGFEGSPQSLAAALTAHAGQLDLGLSAGEAATYLQPNPRTESLLVDVRHDFGGGFEAYFDAIVLWDEGHFVDRALGGSALLFGSSPINPFTDDIVLTFPVSSAVLDAQGSIDSARYTAGVAAPLPRGWRATVEGSWGASQFEARQSALALFNSPGDGGPNPFGSWRQFQQGLTTYQSAATADLRAVNRYADQSLRMAGPVFQTSAGPATLTLLAEHRVETIPGYTEGASGFLAAAASPIAPRSTAATSFYAELRSRIYDEHAPSPLLRDLEVQLALRDDTEVDDFAIDPQTPGSPRQRASFSGIAFTAGAKVSPAPWLMFRASYATGETPPPLDALIQQTTTESAELLADPKRGGALFTNTNQLSLTEGGSPTLGLVRASTISVGAVLTPLGAQGPRFSIDYSRIDKTHDVEGFSDQDVLDHEDAWPQRVQRGPLTPADAALGYTAGPILAIDATDINGAGETVQSLDAHVDWTLPLRIGGVRLYGDATYHFDETTRGRFEAALQDVGFFTSPLTWRANAGAEWSDGPFSLGASVQYFGAYSLLSQGDTSLTAPLITGPQGGDHVPAQAFVDLHLSQRMRLGSGSSAHDATLEFGVVNLFDTAPARVSTYATGVLQDYNAYSDPRRRRFEVTLSGRF